MSMSTIGAPLENLMARVPSGGGSGVCGNILSRMGVDVPEMAPDAPSSTTSVPTMSASASWKPVVGQP